jgi:hypothetical protein
VSRNPCVGGRHACYQKSVRVRNRCDGSDRRHAAIKSRRDLHRQNHPVVAIFGEIQPGDDKTFASVSKGLPANSAIWLNSIGGNVPTAIAIARMVHNAGFSTFVARPPHQCNSACPLILLSGSHVVIRARAYVGFHQSNVPEGTAIGYIYSRRDRKTTK